VPKFFELEKNIAGRERKKVEIIFEVFLTKFASRRALSKRVED